jgi:hypothetical protein
MRTGRAKTVLDDGLVALAADRLVLPTAAGYWPTGWFARCSTDELWAQAATVT